MDKTQPLRKYVSGSVQIAIWNNEITKDGKQFSIKNLTIHRSYKDKDGNWQKSGSIPMNELPELVITLTNIYNDFNNIRSE